MAASVDLHCHTTASYDGRVEPAQAVRLAVMRQLTHLAITDHETIDGALRARDAADAGLTVIIGQEARTTEGDLIALFIERAIPGGLGPQETADLIHEQGGLVGLAHPFDARRPSIGRGAGTAPQLARLARLADYVETYNQRVTDERANERAVELARMYGLPGVAVSDAHTEPEIGTSACTIEREFDGAEALLEALRASVSVRVRGRFITYAPDSSLIDRLRGWIRREPREEG